MNVKTPDPDDMWLSPEEIDDIRRKIPIIYVEAIPVIVDERGLVTHLGLLLRGDSSGKISRTIISGRVKHGETLRSALIRNIEKDVGPKALPVIPFSLTPFHIAEYFPPPVVSPYTDDRQHCVSLVYIVPVRGFCSPRQDALEISWLTPREANNEEILGEMEGGRDKLIRSALSFIGNAPIP